MVPVLRPVVNQHFHVIGLPRRPLAKAKQSSAANPAVSKIEIDDQFSVLTRTDEVIE